MKYLVPIGVIVFFGLTVTVANAAPTTNYFLNIAPTTANTYQNGTASLPWLNIYAAYASTTAVSVSSLTNGNCVQASTGGLLTTVSAACATASTFGTTSITATAPLQWNTLTANLTITRAGTATDGYLSGTDWSTFNNKIGWGQATSTSPNQIVYTDALGKLVSVASSSLMVASSTLLTDTNTFSGVNLFTNALSNFSGTWQTFSPSHFQTALGFTAVPNTRLINTTSPLQGGGDLSADRTLSILAASASQNGYLSSFDYSLLHAATTTFSAPFVYTAGTNAVTCTTASAGVTGCLSGTDWSTFNNKIGWGQATSTSPNQIVYTDALGKLVSVASSSLMVASSTLLGDTNTFSAAATTTFTATTTAVAVATNGKLLYRLAAIFSTSTPGTNTSIVMTGARDSAPAFSAGTLTLPRNTAAIQVELWGSGGGGSGGANSGGVASSGTAGSQSCFGTNATACTSATLTANGGGGGVAGASTLDAGGGGAGGSASGGDLNLTGQGGSGGSLGVAGTHSTGGAAGGSAGRGGGGGNAGAFGVAPGSGGTPGGAGGGGVGNTGYASGGGGGGGGYALKLITTPSATYHYTILAGGGGGAPGSGGDGSGTGGAGAAGGFLITVYTY